MFDRFLIPLRKYGNSKRIWSRFRFVTLCRSRTRRWKCNEWRIFHSLFNNSSFFDFSLTHKIRVGLGAMNQGVSIYHGKMTQIFDCYDESNSELRWILISWYVLSKWFYTALTSNVVFLRKEIKLAYVFNVKRSGILGVDGAHTMYRCQ